MGAWKKNDDPEITYTSVGACMSRVQAFNKVPGYCAVASSYWNGLI